MRESLGNYLDLPPAYFDGHDAPTSSSPRHDAVHGRLEESWNPNCQIELLSSFRVWNPAANTTHSRSAAFLIGEDHACIVATRLAVSIASAKQTQQEVEEL